MARRASSRAKRQPEDGWVWFFKSPLRTMGAIGFFALLVVFILGREVPVWWISLIGGMFGIDGLVGLRGRR